MHIRKFLAIVLLSIVSILLVFFMGFQRFTSIDSTAKMEKTGDLYRFVKIEDKEIQIYQENQDWEEFKVQGIELTSFNPHYAKNKSNIKKTDVMDWLKDIYALNINLIKIPYIQNPAFYKAISQFNQDLKNPIYLMHEIKVDEEALLKHHDIFNSKVTRHFEEDIKNTVDVIHGKAFILNNKRGHSGVYLNDVSKYNMGYILGGDTSPEVITLNNSRYHDKNDFSGVYYSLRDGEAFDVFIAENFEFLTQYETIQYQHLSLLSFLSTLETDGLNYAHEPNLTKDSKININKIKSEKDDNIFVAYQYHPSDVDFLDFEYEKTIGSHLETEINSFYQQLERLNKFYPKPLLITSTGISSSRGVSKVDLMDGYDRGGFSEKEQGEKLVDLLNQIEKAKLSGFILDSWQDTWTRRTSFSMPEDKKDVSASSYWHNVQASDESFGLMAFESSAKNKLLDGLYSDWEKDDFLLDEEIKMKIDSDTDYLYVYLESEESLKNTDLYLGIDVTPLSGSDTWKAKELKFSLPVDFILDLSNVDKINLQVHDRYDLFSYRYRYYSQDVGIQHHWPAKDGEFFSSINSLNRKKFFYADKQETENAIFYQSGKMKRGNSNPKASAFNSNADYNYSENRIELRIPYAMLNIVNPYQMLVYGDLYEEGVDDKIKVKDLGFSIYDKRAKKTYEIKDRYKQKDFRRITYDTRLKESYFILQKYLK